MRRIQACLNGNRPASHHPKLPLTIAALAEDAAACAAAGAVALHVHPRDAAGRETLEPAVIGATIAAIRRAAALPISVSTGDWIEGDAARQAACVQGWGRLPVDQRPDEASVNLAEASAPTVMAALMQGGIGVEAGLATLADADRLLALGLAPRCRRILVEIDPMPEADALSLADAILERIGAPGLERQLHGMDGHAWALARRAAQRGLMLRLGLEDFCEMPNGQIAAGNAAIIATGLSSCWP